MILSRMTMPSRSLLVALLGFLFLVSSAVAGTTEEGLKWLAQKKLEDGVVSLPSGLMYKEERPGTGTPAPRLLQTACQLPVARKWSSYSFNFLFSQLPCHPCSLLFLGKSPTINSPCKCHYSGSLIDGTIFDSSYQRGEPLTFAPNQVIKGWTEAMQLMKEGAKWELYIPSELGYGDRGAGGSIPPGAVLIFTLELMEVLGDSQ